MRSDKIFYSLNIKDIQTVAIDVLERKLTDEEIEKILNPIADRMFWYDAIEDAILLEIGSNDRKKMDAKT
jgi:hypothetical protein